MHRMRNLGQGYEVPYTLLLMIKKPFFQPVSLRHTTRSWSAMPRILAIKMQTKKTVSYDFVLSKKPNQSTVFSNKTVHSTIGLLLLMGSVPLSAHAASASQSGQRVLMVEMTPALCELQPSRARMRQCLEGYSLTVSGLDLGYGSSCGRGSEPQLTPLQLKVVNRIMPDTTVRSQAWQRFGVCSPFSSSNYFRQITNLAGDLKLPSELNTGNSYTVSKSRFISQMTRLNRGLSSSGVDLICQKGTRRQSILTDIHICYEGSKFGRCSNVVDNCGSNFIISGGK